MDLQKIERHILVYQILKNRVAIFEGNYSSAQLYNIKTYLQWGSE